MPPNLLQNWAEGIEAVVAAAAGDPDAKARVDHDLKRFARTTWRTKLISALQRAAEGPTDPNLYAGLDPHGSAIIHAALNRLMK